MAGITLSPKAVIGYLAQTGYKFDRNQGVMEYMLENSDYQASEIRSALASMGFSHQEVREELAMLSGGEMMKLQLTRLLLGRYNILLMDEPSNFLDIPAVEALEAMMRSYKGTILFITHDARLLEHAADTIYEIKDCQIVRKV